MDLASFAGELEQAAQNHDLPQVSRQIGSIGAHCSRCHQELSLALGRAVAARTHGLR